MNTSIHLFQRKIKDADPILLNGSVLLKRIYICKKIVFF